METLTCATKRLLGLAAALLLLAAPAAAEEAGSDQCAASRPSALDAEVRAFIQQVRRDQVAAGEPDDGETVVLNNRGYNYGPPPGIELDRIRAEILRNR